MTSFLLRGQGLQKLPRAERDDAPTGDDDVIEHADVEEVPSFDERQGIAPGQLTVHADRGAAMSSKPVAFLLADRGVTKNHSRPHVSKDNPYSKAQFKTLKYRPDFPDRFGSPEHVRSFCSDFFPWYSTEHHHVGLGPLTPHDVHYGLAEAKRERRAEALAAAFDRHPERFPQGRSVPKPLPTAAWINPPANRTDLSELTVADAGVAGDPGTTLSSQPRGRTT